MAVTDSFSLVKEFHKRKEQDIELAQDKFPEKEFKRDRELLTHETEFA